MNTLPLVNKFSHINIGGGNFCALALHVILAPQLAAWTFSYNTDKGF